MTNPVLAESGPLSNGLDIVLVHYGSTLTTTRGTRGRLSVSAAELRAAFAVAGHNAWVPTPKNRTKVEFVVVLGETFRVIDEERISGGIYDTTRYLLQDDPHP